MDPALIIMLPKQGDTLQIKPVYDAANNMVHFQSEPFLNNQGEIVVRRLASFPVIVEKVHQVVEEYQLRTTY